MATWAQADLDKLKAAIVALASGEQAMTVSYGGPPQRSVTYHPANLSEMRKLLAEMTHSVSGSTRYRRVQFRKGFR